MAGKRLCSKSSDGKHVLSHYDLKQDDGRGWRVYECRRCGKNVAYVPLDFDPTDITLEGVIRND